MCAICGGYNVNIGIMLETMKHRGPDVLGVFEDGRVSLGHNLLSIVGEGMQPLQGCDNDFVLVCNGEIYNHEELREKLSAHDFKSTSDNEVILHLIEENYEGDLVSAVKESLPELDGDYAFAAYYKGEVVLARDPIGVKPLYFSEDSFASERKALWRQGKKAMALKPGGVMRLGGKIEGGVNLHSFRKNVEKPVEELARALSSAVEKRTRGVKVGLLFSGGLDSSLLARVIGKLDRKITLYTVGLEDCLDFEYAERAAKYLNLRVKYRVIEEGELVGYARKVIYAIEEYDPMKVCVGIPLYAACEAARKDGLKVVLAGQGADELFAGYSRYLRMAKDKLERELLVDLERIAEVNLQRDDAIAMANSLEMRIPYLDKGVVGIALGLPLEYKIKEGRRKHILRLVAKRKGLPEFIVERDKKAIQYSTGVEKALRRLAKEANICLKDYLKGIYEELFKWT